MAALKSLQRPYDSRRLATCLGIPTSVEVAIASKPVGKSSKPHLSWVLGEFMHNSIKISEGSMQIADLGKGQDRRSSFHTITLSVLRLDFLMSALNKLNFMVVECSRDIQSPAGLSQDFVLLGVLSAASTHCFQPNVLPRFVD